jgi:hypothetical protein
MIGLLFVAISVAPERVLGPDAPEVHAIRAAAALTAFSNALSVALFSLIPGFNPGGPATVVAVLGLIFTLGALIRLVPPARAGEIRPRELSFLAGLAVVFALQLNAGLELLADPGGRGALQTVCVLVAVCFLIGIGRAWELVGGPRVRLFGVLIQSRRAARRRDDGDGR